LHSKKLTLFLASVFFVILSKDIVAQQNPEPAPSSQAKPKMIYMGQFDAGQPNAGIYKLYDPTDQVLCYILMPEVSNRKQVGNVWTYESNSLGSLSCVKVQAPIKPEKTATKNGK
jgi:hypothetical protein